MSESLTIFDELSVSFENPAGDAMGYDIVEGKLICQATEVVIQFKQKDRAFRKNPIQSAKFGYREIESINYVSRWFQPKRLIFSIYEAAKLDSFPGAGIGSVDLYVAKESLSEAKRVANLIDYKKSEIRLAESESLLRRRDSEP
ncbi:MAG: hypothetical protein P1U58_03460 [Verrucomicrobiales bacterium]|nr:hypothetical protein [Verrucomicrobiales bacterium]